MTQMNCVRHFIDDCAFRKVRQHSKLIAGIFVTLVSGCHPTDSNVDVDRLCLGSIGYCGALVEHHNYKVGHLPAKLEEVTADVNKLRCPVTKKMYELRILTNNQGRAVFMLVDSISHNGAVSIAFNGPVCFRMPNEMISSLKLDDIFISNK